MNRGRTQVLSRVSVFQLPLSLIEAYTYTLVPPDSSAEGTIFFETPLSFAVSRLWYFSWHELGTENMPPGRELKHRK